MNPPPTVAFIGPERTDARSVKRIAGLSDQGWHVLGFTFHRERGQPDPAPGWENIHLGNTYNRRYFHRIWAIVRGFWIVFRNRRRIGAATCIHAINPDNAILGIFARFVSRSRVPLLIEIADIQPVMTRGGMAARVLRALERRVLRRSQMLLTTSPGFVRHYFEPVQGFRGPVFMMENKVYPAAALLAARIKRTAPARGGRPWVIGYLGVFRCQRSIDLICRLAGAFPEQVAFVLRGVPAGLDADRFRTQIAAHANIDYGGPYRYPDDLPGIYASVDLNWCFDFSAFGANSTWLLPNRIYEGGLFHCPALAFDGTETGRWVETNGCGRVFGEDLYARLHEFLASLSVEAWTVMKDRCEAAPDELFSGEGDYRGLSAAMLQLAGAVRK